MVQLRRLYPLPLVISPQRLIVGRLSWDAHFVLVGFFSLYFSNLFFFTLIQYSHYSEWNISILEWNGILNITKSASIPTIHVHWSTNLFCIWCLSFTFFGLIFSAFWCGWNIHTWYGIIIWSNTGWAQNGRFVYS